MDESGPAVNTHVVILAQGEQKRLPHLVEPKQMLRLPACNNTPILYRTLAQLSHLAEPYRDGVGKYRGTYADITIMSVDIVAWLPLSERILTDDLPLRREVYMTTGTSTLPDPGNSSLKGLSRYLTSIAHREPADRTVVLLGDVVYSWACMRALFEDGVAWRFVGTKDISESGGELWGIAWTKGDHAARVHECIKRAMERHPSFSAYQPGQLRRILWETLAPSIAGLGVSDHRAVIADAAERGALALPWYRAIDDYTMDIDVPKHLDDLARLSRAAADDDKENGLAW